jgi:hypothetical protein
LIKYCTLFQYFSKVIFTIFQNASDKMEESVALSLYTDSIAIWGDFHLMSCNKMEDSFV